MYRAFCFLAILFLSCTGIASPSFSKEITLSATPPSYMNVRYDFSFSLPAGDYSVVEAENSDGVTVKDGKGFTLLAYGTRIFVVLEKNFTTAFKEMADELDTITKEVVHPELKTFEITGLKGNNLIHIKCIFGEKHANILRITHGKSAHQQYKEFCETALKTFK